MRIAIVGSGISGLVTGHLLHQAHDVTLFEAAPRLGGHTHTVDVTCERQAHGAFIARRSQPGDQETVHVDTGFIVFNPRNYPNFVRLLDRLSVASQPSDMGFSASMPGGVCYAGRNLNTLFAQRRNLCSPGFWHFVFGILRFNAAARRQLIQDRTASEDLTLGEFLRKACIPRRTVRDYVVPMGAAIWSAPPSLLDRFPARRFARFLANHGMLQAGDDRPQWRTITGGAQRYVDAITAPWRDRIRLACPVHRVARCEDGRVDLVTDAGHERFDRVILACHSNQALRLLHDPLPGERAALAGIPYQENPTVLHSDTRMMPPVRRAWSAWNYRIGATDTATVTYWQNCLQRFDAPLPLLVSLNAPEIADGDAIMRYTYEHPQFLPGSDAAQAAWASIDGVGGIHFCGAYWGQGFHEDGVVSALRVAAKFGASL